MTIPIKLTGGVELVSTTTPGVCNARVFDATTKTSLPWDRYVRLKAASDTLNRLAGPNSKVIDVGGYDGALALFLPTHHIDVIDPATTGACSLKVSLPDLSYEVVTAIDVLEHIEPTARTAFLQELARMAKSHVILNYPSAESKAAQELVLKATNNSLIREHVEWDLPDTAWVVATMQKLGFNASVIAHSSLAVWVGQYLTLNLAPDAGQELNRYLVQHHSDEPFAVSLYHLVVCERHQ